MVTKVTEACVIWDYKVAGSTKDDKINAVSSLLSILQEKSKWVQLNDKAFPNIIVFATVIRWAAMSLLCFATQFLF